MNCSVQEKDNKIFSHIRKMWLIKIPEEIVRQNYLLTLVNEYSYSLDQIDEELTIAGRGAGKARADFVIWKSVEDKQKSKAPLIIVECKSDNITISRKDYTQGENYSRITDAPFFITHNSKETKYWRVKKDRMPGYIEEIEDIPKAGATERQIDELLAHLKVFKENEFADLLHSCHNIIRNREKLDPVAAFDEIAKILFMKVYAERHLKADMKNNIFTLDYVEQAEAFNPEYLVDVFEKTKREFGKDKIFGIDEKINLRANTIKAIIEKLEKYNLSGTSTDIKGIAFEKFLGKTFRGEIGQFFTPRPIVEFMLQMVEPKANDVICDPASGSGGFLIRFFETVREQIYASIDKEYQRKKAVIEKEKGLSKEEKAEKITKVYDELQKQLEKELVDSRIWKLANRCIYGTDANDRMARTSKMNMIMHGDGHGGIHYHDGFLNVNGIFEEKFDIVLTNPPFGQSVEKDDTVVDAQIELD
jgi:type I restriction enzyme M protein